MRGYVFNTLAIFSFSGFEINTLYRLVLVVYYCPALESFYIAVFLRNEKRNKRKQKIMQITITDEQYQELLKIKEEYQALHEQHAECAAVFEMMTHFRTQLDSAANQLNNRAEQARVDKYTIRNLRKKLQDEIEKNSKLLTYVPKHVRDNSEELLK